MGEIDKFDQGRLREIKENKIGTDLGRLEQTKLKTKIDIKGLIQIRQI